MSDIGTWAGYPPAPSWVLDAMEAAVSEADAAEQLGGGRTRERHERVAVVYQSGTTLTGSVEPAELLGGGMALVLVDSGAYGWWPLSMLRTVVGEGCLAVRG